MNLIENVSENRCFGGWHKQYQHHSSTLNCNMRFAIFLPPQIATGQRVPVLYWLSGLTCNDENFMQKAGAQRLAAELGLAIVAPDTSPRGADVADADRYDLGQGAGFYVNATQAPWDSHYHMYDYIVDELPALIEANFSVSTARAIAGHSMGGHGALMIALRNPQRYRSVSAFSPICNPMRCPWGQQAFTAYLGEQHEAWMAYDTTSLLAKQEVCVPGLVDQGEADDFLALQLHLTTLENTVAQVNAPIEIRRHTGYDHSYYFIASFIADHLRFHATHLATL